MIMFTIWIVLVESNVFLLGMYVGYEHALSDQKKWSKS